MNYNSQNFKRTSHKCKEENLFCNPELDKNSQPEKSTSSYIFDSIKRPVNEYHYHISGAIESSEKDLPVENACNNHLPAWIGVLIAISIVFMFSFFQLFIRRSFIHKMCRTTEHEERKNLKKRIFIKLLKIIMPELKNFGCKNIYRHIPLRIDFKPNQGKFSENLLRS